MNSQLWDERYSVSDYIYGTGANDFLAQSASLIPPGDVLCLAEGEGRNAVFLAKQGYAVTGVDSSRVGLEKARKLAAQNGVSIQTIIADLADYCIEPGKWSGVVSIFCHLAPPMRRRLHGQVVAGLRPGGVFILESYTPRQLAFGTGGPPVAELTMEKDEIVKELAGLGIKHAMELERDVVEGQYHNGRGAVLQIIAQRD